MKEYLSKTIDSIGALPGFNLIESKANNNTMLGSKSMYTLVYTYNANHTTYKVREIGVILGDDKIFKIQYFAEPLKYNNYLPIVQKMIDSFEFNNPILKYENPRLGIKMLYPYNWERHSKCSPWFLCNITIMITSLLLDCYPLSQECIIFLKIIEWQ